MAALVQADFWGLKKDNGVHGLDGNSLTVTGYKKSGYSPGDQFNYVYRWLWQDYSISAPFNLVLKLSGNKKGCVWVE